MELYLFTKELPIILTKPGLLQQAPVGGAGGTGGGTPPAATPPADKPGAAAPAAGAAEPAKTEEPAAKEPKDKTSTAPAAAEPKGEAGKKGGKAKPAEAAPPEAPQTSAGTITGPNEKVQEVISTADAAGAAIGQKHAQDITFQRDGETITIPGVKVTRGPNGEVELESLENQLKQRREDIRDEIFGGTTYESFLKKQQDKQAELDRRIASEEDPEAKQELNKERAAVADSISTAGQYVGEYNALGTQIGIVNDLGEAKQHLKKAKGDDQLIALAGYTSKRSELGGRSIQDAWQSIADGDDVDYTKLNMAYRGVTKEAKGQNVLGIASAGGESGSGGGFLKGVQDFNTGVGAITATGQGLTALTRTAQQLGYALGGYPPGFGVYNPGFGGFGPYGGFGGGFGGGYGAAGGFGGGYGVAGGGFGGGFNLALGGFGMGYGFYDQRAQDRKLSYIINMLMFSIAAGNIDAISTALIMIARQGKESLRRTAVSAIAALQSYERQQSHITDMMQNLNANNNPNYASQLQSLSSRMNTYSSNRQMIVSLLRDVKSMSDELENMSKSYQDTSLQHQKRQMIFA